MSISKVLRKKLVPLFFIPLLFCLSGCLGDPGISVIASLEDMTSDYQQTKGLWFLPDPFTQYKLINISGQLDVPQVGFVYYFKPKHGPAAAVGLSDAKSFYVTFTVDDTTLTPDTVEAVRDEVVQVHILAVRAMLKKAAVINAKEEAMKWEERLTADLEKMPANKDKINFSKTRCDSALAALQAAQQEYEAASTAFNSRYIKLVSSIKNHGVFVYRWVTESKGREGTALGPILSVAGMQSVKYNGFAVLGGFRASKLHVGRDFDTAWGHLKSGGTFFKPRMGTMTHLLQTRYLLYVSDMDIEKEITANLKASAQQLANVRETLKKLDSVEFDYYSKKIQNLSNLAHLGSPKWKVHDIFVNKGQIDDLVKVQEVLDKSADWQTVYAVFTELNALKKIFSN